MQYVVFVDQMRASVYAKHLSETFIFAYLLNVLRVNPTSDRLTGTYWYNMGMADRKFDPVVRSL